MLGCATTLAPATDGEENVELKKKTLSLSLNKKKTLVISEAHQKSKETLKAMATATAQ